MLFSMFQPVEITQQQISAITTGLCQFAQYNMVSYLSLFTRDCIMEWMFHKIFPVWIS